MRSNHQAASPEKVNMMWSGPLGPMERMCIESFVRHGHPVNLWAYDDLDRVPAGVTLCDAGSIVMRDSMNDFQNPQNFSDYFRYALLARRGGWWMDCDVYCLRPLVFPTHLVLGLAGTDPELYYAGMLRVPPASPVMTECLHYISTIDTKTITFQHIGPELLTRVAQAHGTKGCVYYGRVFDPVTCLNISRLTDPTYKPDLSESFTIHLFGAAWAGGPQSQHQTTRIHKDGTYPAGCVYERLKAGVSLPPLTPAVPIPPPRLGPRRYSLTGVSDWNDRYKLGGAR